jgi:hypothetical protein
MAKQRKKATKTAKKANSSSTSTSRRLNNKATRKLAQSFAKKLGVSVESERSGNAAKQSATTTGAAAAAVQRKARKAAKRQERLRRRAAAVSKRQPDGHHHSGSNENHQNEFALEHASVQARGRAATGGNDIPANRPQTTTSTTTTAAPALQFDPPTFAFLPHQKSTQQLIAEATRQVQSTNLLGDQSTLWNANTMSSSASTLRLPTRTTPASTPVRRRPLTQNTNPFAPLSLTHDPEGDEEEVNPKTSRDNLPVADAVTASLHFAPPSFALPSPSAADTTTKTAAAAAAAGTVPDDNSIDPDL